MTSLFPNPPRRHTWAKADFDLTMRPDCDGPRTKLILSLMYLADGLDSIVSTREEILAASGLKVGKYLDGMRWLRSLGAVEEAPEPAARSGRRIILAWVRDPEAIRSRGSHQPPARARTTGGRAPGRQGGGARTTGGRAPGRQGGACPDRAASL